MGDLCPSGHRRPGRKFQERGKVVISQEQLLSSRLSLGECVCQGQEGGPALWLVQGEWAAVAELGGLLSPLTPQHVQMIIS